MKKGYKFVSRLIVGVLLILLAGLCLWSIIKTIVVPSLPMVSGAQYVQDDSGSMSEPDKSYAENAIEEASKNNKIAILLDYQLTTFTITDSYIDSKVNSMVESVYRNQHYIIYTYFADTDTFVITTNIDDTANDVVDKTKTEIGDDARVVKEILYYQQNLTKQHGLGTWNFNLTSSAMRNVCLCAVGTIILLILGIGVLPSVAEGLKNPFRKKRRAEANHS